MIEWDGVRYFLAVVRGGSVRSAAQRLAVNHSTVLRRIAQLEERLGARLFEKLPSGYRLTDAGAQVQEFAEQMEASSNQLETRLLGRDQGLRGRLRITTAPTIATHLLMRDMTEFARCHPEIELEISSTEQRVNLTNREADIALRVVRDRHALPPNLHGLKGPELADSAYISRDLLAAWRAGTHEAIRWIVRSVEDIPEWMRDSDIPVAEVPIRIPEAGAHVEALRQGMGMAALPCFVGDSEPQLVRVPGANLGAHGTLWLLTQGDTRKTRRVRLLVDFLFSRLNAYAALLAGHLPREE